MKNTASLRIVYLSVVLLCSLLVNGQKLKTSEIDEFTGVRKLATSWEYIGFSMGFSPRIRLLQSDETFLMNLKTITHPKVISVNKDDRLFIKFEDETIIELYNLEYTISCTGCGATGFNGSEGQGVNLYFNITEQDLIDLKEKTIVKVRLEANNGYFESKTKPKHAEKINTLAALVIN